MQVLGEEASELQGWSSQEQIGEDGEGVHEHFAHQLVGKMLDIMGPYPLEVGPFHELAEDGVDAVPPARELSAEVWPGILSAAAKGGEERESLLRQLRSQAGRPEVAVPYAEALRVFGQVQGGGQLGPLAWGELDLADNAGPADPGVEAKAGEGASGEVISAKARFPSKPPAPGRSGELTHGDGDAVENGQGGVMG